MKIVILLLAIALLVAGIFYSGVEKKIVKAPPARPGNIVKMKVKTAPPPVNPEPAVNPGTEASIQQQGISATAVNDTADKIKPAAPVPADRPYGIKVSYTQDLNIAEREAEELKSKGHETYIAKVDLKEKGIWYRIFIGPFASEKDARAYIRGKKIADVYPGWMIYKGMEVVARGYGIKKEISH